MNKVQELQQEIVLLRATILSLQVYHPNPNFGHGRLGRKTYEGSLRHIDWSLNHNMENIKATSILCECGRCDGYLLDWPGRSFKIWDGMPGACPYRVAIQLRRISFHRHEDIDPNIVERLLKVSRQV